MSATMMALPSPFILAKGANGSLGADIVTPEILFFSGVYMAETPGDCQRALIPLPDQVMEPAAK